MKISNYREISGPDGHLANLRPFQGNSMSAHVSSEGDYVVYSYRTPIAWFGTDGVAIHNDTRYSVTTSKHQGYTRAWLGFRAQREVAA